MAPPIVGCTVNSAALHDVVDISNALRQLIADGHPVNADDVASLSPYVTRTIKRFGNYAIPAGDPPEPLDGEPSLEVIWNVRATRVEGAHEHHPADDGV